jgi:hypothetical protein
MDHVPLMIDGRFFVRPVHAQNQDAKAAPRKDCALSVHIELGVLKTRSDLALIRARCSGLAALSTE